MKLLEDLQLQCFPCPFSNPQISSQKAVPVPAPSPLIASKASSASSLLSPSLLLSLSLLSHSLRPLRFSLCFSSIWSCSFFFCSSSSANRFLAAGSNVLGNASPPGTIAGTEARWFVLKRWVRGYVVEDELFERKGGGARYEDSNGVEGPWWARGPCGIWSDGG